MCVWCGLSTVFRLSFLLFLFFFSFTRSLLVKSLEQSCSVWLYATAYICQIKTNSSTIRLFFAQRRKACFIVHTANVFFVIFRWSWNEQRSNTATTKRFPFRNIISTIHRFSSLEFCINCKFFWQIIFYRFICVCCCVYLMVLSCLLEIV